MWGKVVFNHLGFDLEQYPVSAQRFAQQRREQWAEVELLQIDLSSTAARCSSRAESEDQLEMHSPQPEERDPLTAKKISAVIFKTLLNNPEDLWVLDGESVECRGHCLWGRDGGIVWHGKLRIAASKCMSRYMEQRTRPEERSADLFQLCFLHLCTCALCWALLTGLPWYKVGLYLQIPMWACRWL